MAVWKNNPSARFQLMRKHPVQSGPGYVLGKQIEEELAPATPSLIYESSNGDSLKSAAGFKYDSSTTTWSPDGK